MKYLKKTLILLASMFTFSISAYSTNDLLILSIVNPKNLGDASQIRGVVHSLKQKLPEHNYITKEIECDKVEEAVKLLKKHKGKSLVLSSGNTGGIEALKIINHKVDNVFSVYISYQLFENHPELLKSKANPSGADLIVLPKHAANNEWKGLAKESDSKILYVTGVPHNLFPEQLDEEYKNYPNLLVTEANPKFTIVILGGDAQNPDKSWNYYTTKDSAFLAKHVSKKLDKDSYLVILNGPRTGKFIPESGIEDTNAHRMDALDPVTKSFVEYFVGRERTYIFDFKYGKPSMSRAVLGAAMHSAQSTIWVPEESTSMISEIVDNFSGDKKYKIIVYEHGAMNAVHQKHIMTEYNAGHINLVTADGSLKKQLRISKDKAKPATEIVADKIMKMSMEKGSTQ